MNIFHISEIMDLGIEKEKKRRDFYGLVAEQFREQQLKELFSRLRDWEQTHIKKFTEIKDTLPPDEAAQTYPGELSAYMQALVDDKLYKISLVQEFRKNVKTPLDAVRYGIEFEKDAILFFVEIKDYTLDPHKEIIQKLLAEERQHIIYLLELQKKLNSQ
ncbi:MAG: ferritin family protein [Candidatus Omnitrophica bacterium]|nr:ferritin family protein [Candidatus Omnitrophota bacterium]